MGYIAGTNASAARKLRGGRAMPKAVFPIEVLRILAVDAFVELATAEERQRWARAHGVDRLLSEKLVKAVREAHANRATNARLGLPDPLRKT